MRGCWGRVLIETLWNVNYGLDVEFDSKERVLIETLWNVNFLTCLCSRLPTSFNRNIVECKLCISMTCSGVMPVLIETLWNVNLGKRKESVQERLF